MTELETDLVDCLAGHSDHECLMALITVMGAVAETIGGSRERVGELYRKLSEAIANERDGPIH